LGRQSLHGNSSKPRIVILKVEPVVWRSQWKTSRG
jgi:hypothetical protein